MKDRRERLRELAAAGVSSDPVAHAEQVARISALIHEACNEAGLRSTLVGGSAIEVHAPGIYRSGDIDFVIEMVRHDAERVEEVFQRLGLERYGRHWRIGDWFIEVPGTRLVDPAEWMRVGDSVFHVVTKEVVLADRVVGFKQWQVTAYGQQAIDMLSAFGDELDTEWLRPKLEREDSYDAFLVLRELGGSSGTISERELRALLDQLRQRRDPP